MGFVLGLDGVCFGGWLESLMGGRLAAGLGTLGNWRLGALESCVEKGEAGKGEVGGLGLGLGWLELVEL